MVQTKGLRNDTNVRLSVVSRFRLSSAMWSKIEMRSSCATGRYRSLYLPGIRSASELGNHLLVGDTFLSLRRLYLCDSKFLKKIRLSLEALVVIYAHHYKIPFAVRSKIHRFVLLMTNLGDLARSVSEARYGFYYWHILPGSVHVYIEA